MLFSEFKMLLTSICEEVSKRDKYISSIPTDIRVRLFDNEYINSLNKTLDLLLQHTFKEYFNDVDWFLYQVYIFGAPQSITVSDRTYIISDLETFLHYAKVELKFKEL